MESSGKYIFAKILLLALFLLTANAWLTYHIGNDFIETYFVGGVVVFFGFVSFLIKYLKKEEEEKINQIYTRWLSGFLNFQVIAGLYLFLFVGGCFVSSVHLSTGKKQAVSVSLHRAGESASNAVQLEVSGDRPSSQKTVWTTPFGRTFTIEASGYQKLSFQVYPWAGKRIDLDEDLALSPTVIVRVPVEFFMQLSRARLVVAHNKQLTVTYELDNHATIIMGQLAEIPQSYFERWQIELRGLYEESVTIYSSLNKWTVQEPLFVPIDFQVYDSLRLELTSANGKIFAVCDGLVGTETFKELQFKTWKE